MTNIDQAVALIESLYSNTLSPQQVVNTQISLQALQKHPSGLNLAEKLLNPANNYSLVCQFFGALTYSVQLNRIFAIDIASNKSPNIDNVVQFILSKQLDFLKLLIMQNLAKTPNLFVIRKVLSNLSLIYINRSHSWRNPLLTFLALEEGINLDISAADVEGKLPPIDLKTPFLMMFSQIVVEDILKASTMQDKLDKELHVKLKNEVFSVTEYYINGVITASPLDSDLFSSSLKCFSAWISYISYSHLNSTEKFVIESTLNGLISFLVDHKSPDELTLHTDLISEVLEFLANLVEIYANLVSASLKNTLSELIFKDWGMNYLNFLSSNDESLSENEQLVANFSKLIISYFELDMARISTFLIDEDCAYIFQALLKLTEFPGIPVLQEEVSRIFIEFWSELSDFLIDNTDSLLIFLKSQANLKLFEANFKKLLVLLSRIYWSKIKLPFGTGMMEEIDGEQKDEYLSYRRDVFDLFETIFPAIQDTLVKTLAGNIVSNCTANASAESLSEIEASLYLLDASVACFSDENVPDSVISLFVELFSQQYSFLKAGIDTENYHLLSTTVQLLSSLEFFYKHKDGVNYLSDILQYLFKLLEVASTSKKFPEKFEYIVGRSICTICRECRASLLDNLAYLEPLLEQVLFSSSYKPFIRETIVSAASYIIQSIDSDWAAQYISRMLDLITSSFKGASDLVTFSEDKKELLDFMVSLVSCVYDMAKGMQLPDDAQNLYDAEKIEAINKFWAEDKYSIHQKIMDLLAIMTLNRELNGILVSHYNDGKSIGAGEGAMAINYHNQITEKCCQILRAGISEEIGGPFKFSNADIVTFLMTKFDDILKSVDLNRPNSSLVLSLTYIYGLVETLFISEYRELDKQVIESCVKKLILDNLQVLNIDLDLCAQAVKIVNVLLEKKPSLLFQSKSNSLTAICEACLAVLKSSKEKFVIKTVVRFWSLLITLRSGTMVDQAIAKQMLEETQLGQSLTTITIASLIKSTRSVFDVYCEIIRSLIGKYPLKFKEWLGVALKETGAESRMKRPGVFVQQLMVTRGNRKVDGLVKSFWLEVNGLIEM